MPQFNTEFVEDDNSLAFQVPTGLSLKYALGPKFIELWHEETLLSRYNESDLEKAKNGYRLIDSSSLPSRKELLTTMEKVNCDFTAGKGKNIHEKLLDEILSLLKIELP